METKIKSLRCLSSLYSETRRLGILTFLVKNVQVEGTPEIQLVQLMYSQRGEINRKISQYSPDPSGKIVETKSKTFVIGHSGIDSHLKVARAINVIQKFGGNVVLSRFGRVINSLLNCPYDEKKNLWPIELSYGERLCYLKAILESDLHAFLDLLMCAWKPKPLTDLIETFRQKLIDDLEYFQGSKYDSEENVRQKLVSLKSGKYRSFFPKHVRSRLGWAIDLGLVQKIEERYALTKPGATFISHVPCYDGVYLPNDELVENFLNSNFYHAACFAYCRDSVRDLTRIDSELRRLILDEIKELVKKRPLPQVPMSTLAEIVSIKGVLKRMGTVERKDLDKIFDVMSQMGYIKCYHDPTGREKYITFRPQDKHN